MQACVSASPALLCSRGTSACAGDKFALTDGQGDDGELLTHMGRSLGASDTHEVSSYVKLWLQ